jgi:putative addiction module killer protein
MIPAFQILRYVTASGHDVLGEWSKGLRDLRTRAKIAVRIDRLSAGNFGDCKSLGRGLHELRIDWGPGYRVYYAAPHAGRVLILCAGEKRKQASDIKRAREYLQDYNERAK